MRTYGVYKKKTVQTVLALALFLLNAPLALAQTGGANLAISAASFIGSNKLDEFLADLSTSILGLFGHLTALAGGLLNSSVQFSVVKMSEYVNRIDAIEVSWRIFRDFANIFFIFILIYAAVAVILRVANFQIKQVIMRLVIVALLVNFSLFFAKALIDISNIVALQFYNAIAICDGAPLPGGGCENYKGLSDAFREALQLTSVMSASTGEVFEPDNLLAVTITGTLFLLIATFVFFAGALLFITRFALLILIMIVAPFAFVMAILPKTSSYFTTWWQMLLKQALFAPIYLALTYLSIRIVSDPNFKAIIYGSSFDQELTAPTGAAVATLGFGIVSALLIASLVVAQKMGMKGSDTIIGWGKGITKWGTNKIMTTPKHFAGRATTGLIGGTADALNKQLGNTKFFNRPSMIKLRKETLEKATEAKFGAKSSYKDYMAAKKNLKEESKKAISRVESQRILTKRGATDTEIKEAVKKLNVKQLEELGATVLSRPEVAKHLSEGQLQGLSKSEKVTDDNMEKIKKAHYKEFLDSVTGGNQVEVERILNRMSIKQAADQDFETLQNPLVAKNLSSEQLESVLKRDDLNDQEKENIKNARFEDLNSAVRSGISADIKSALRNLSVKELENVSITTITNSNVIQNLSSSQIEGISKSNKFTAQQKQTIRNERIRPITEGINTGNGAQIQTAFGAMSPKEIAQLGGNILSNQVVLPYLSPAVLNEMMGSADENTRRSITASRHLLNQSAQNWLNSPAGDLFRA